MNIINQIFSQIFIVLYSVLGNLGLTIIIFTVIIRTILMPLTLPSIKARKEMSKLKPELDKLKDKYGSDKKALQLAQLSLYKKYKVNPLSGCLPQIIQLVIIIILYQFLQSIFKTNQLDGLVIDPKFLWLDLSQADNKYVLPVLAGATQLFLSLMIIPGAEIRDIIPNQSKSKQIQAANKKEEDMAEMADTMQKQMVFLMPLMTTVIAFKFTSGLVLYWVVSTLFSIVQQYFISGLGGVKEYAFKLVGKKNY